MSWFKWKSNSLSCHPSPLRCSPCTFPAVTAYWSGGGKVRARTRLFVLHHPGVFYYFCCPGCYRNTPLPIDFSLIGHGGPRRGGTICCTELLKHLGSSLQRSGEILLSNLGLISEIRSWVKLLYIHSTRFLPGVLARCLPCSFTHSGLQSFSFLPATIVVPLGNPLPVEGQGVTMYYMVIIIAHCGFNARRSDRLVLPHLQKAVKMSMPQPDLVAFHVHVSGNSFSPSGGRKTPDAGILPFKPEKPVHQGRDESVHIRLRIINHVPLQKDSH